MGTNMDGWILVGEIYNGSRAGLQANISSIDKTSSSELSEAINSMFSWYQNSDICYAYLSDVLDLFSVYDPNWMGQFDVKGLFKWSAWFTRGWTLQELIAPSIVEFYSADWKSLGTKEGLKKEIAGITGINPRALSGENLSAFNIAEKVSWASTRTTTRLEDKAYSLLGIFDVNMPLLYGEGNKAFLRLQEEIIKMSEDFTIFAWPGAVDPVGALSTVDKTTKVLTYSVFASDPSEFRQLEAPLWQYYDLVRIPEEEIRIAAPHESRSSSKTKIKELEDLSSDDNPLTITGRGLRICLPLMYIKGQEYLAATCYKVKHTGEWLCVPLMRNETKRQQFTRNSWQSYGVQLIQINYPQTVFKRCTIYAERIDGFSLRKNSDSRKYKQIRKLMDRKHFEDAMRLTRRLYSSQNPIRLNLVRDVVQAYLAESRYKDAELIGAELVETSKASLGEKNKCTFMAQVYHSVAISKQGEWDTAEGIFHDLAMRYGQIEGDAYGETLICKTRRAENMFNKDQQKGIQYFQSALNHFNKRFDYHEADTESPKEFITLLWSKLKEVGSNGPEMLDTLAQVSKITRGEEDLGTLWIMFCQEGLEDRPDFSARFVFKFWTLLGRFHRLTILAEASRTALRR